MSKILLDGESVYIALKVIDAMRNKKLGIVEYDALLNIITAIVLWDDIYIFHECLNSHHINGIKYFQQYSSNFHKIKPTYRLPDDLRKIELSHLFEYREGENLNYYDLKPDENGNYKSVDIIPYQNIHGLVMILVIKPIELSNI